MTSSPRTPVEPTPRDSSPATAESLAASRPAGLADAARDAVARSLPEIEREGNDWMEGRVAIQGGRSCVSCHHVGYAIWVHEEAHRAGIDIPEDRITDLTRRAVRAVSRPGISRPMSTGPLSIALSRTSLERSSDLTPADLAALLRDSREPDGHFRARGQFPDQRRPEAETDTVATMWTVLTIAALEPGGSIDRAQTGSIAWLDARKAPGDDRTTELVAVTALLDVHRGRESAAAEGIRFLVETQNADGGWGWRAGEPSNALTTGQVLYVLAIAGGLDIDPGLHAGATWLVDTQREDGRWDVPSFRFSSAASTRRDTVYEFWGTAWATIGLSRSLQRLRGSGLDVARR